MGLAERHVDLADQRARLLRLTPQGCRLVRPLLARVTEQNPELDRPGAGRGKRGYAGQQKRGAALR